MLALVTCAEAVGLDVDARPFPDAPGETAAAPAAHAPLESATFVPPAIGCAP